MAGSRLLVIASVTVAVASVLATGLIFLRWGPGHVFAAAPSAAAISEQSAKLRVKTSTVESTSEKAGHVRGAIKRSDFSTAHQIVAGVLADSRLQNWRFHPFSDFIVAVSNANDPVLERNLDAWVADSKDDPIPFLVRAQYFHDQGWFVRGSGFVSETSTGNMASFQDYMKKALADIDAAIHLNGDNPYSFYLKLRILRGNGDSDGVRSTFEEATAKYPEYYPAYDIVLSMLEPKWGGSVEAMYGFVDEFAGHAAEYSPLKFLYLSLYARLLNAASIACLSQRDEEKKANCVAQTMQRIAKPDLERSILAALQLYDHSDQYQFGVAIEGILDGLLMTGGGDAYAHALLELAAQSMHADTQLKQDKPGTGNYVIDGLIALSWFRKGFYENALTKNEAALKSIDATVFPSNEEKDQAVAKIYENYARTYNKLGQFPEMIAFEKAAVELSGSWKPPAHYICYGYYRLKAFDEAIQACTNIIENDATYMVARYWRSQAYRDIGKADLSLQDLASVADSEDESRAVAAIGVSMNYFDRKDNKGALDALNKYAYLYDPDVTSKNSVAVAYNNRCYAYMQLGELEKALQDCTASLKYGSLPDAYRKQLELIKRLRTSETSL